MKLIEANKLIHDINGTEILKDSSNTYFKLVDLIRNQPTAYDTNKVCEQIKEESDNITYTKTGDNEQHTEIVSYIKTKDALDIIEAGGVVSNKTKTLTEEDILSKFNLDQRRVYGTYEIEKIIRNIFK